MGPTVVLQPRTSRALGAALMAIAGAGLITTAMHSLAALLDYGAPLLLVGLLAWAAFWRPFVEVSDGEVTVANTLRTVHVPWPSIQAVEGRYGLTLRTAYGPVTAWAASAPAGRQRARGEASAAAAAVEERLEALRAAGHLDDSRLERATLLTEWQLPVIAASAVLLVASLVLPLLG